MEKSQSEALAKILCRPVDGKTRSRAAIHVRDWIACCMVGAASDRGRQLSSYASTQPDGECFTFSSGKCTANVAAFVNGGFGSLYEMDDIHRTSIVHPGDVVIPAALSVAQANNLTGAAFLDAIVRGYEAAIRIGMAAGPGHYEHWYNTATCGVFGSAVAAASLLNLNSSQMVDALGHAGMQSTGLWQCRLEPGLSKQLAAGKAASAGIDAANLACAGFAGPHMILEGGLGFFAAMAPGASPEQVSANPDAQWYLYQTSFKPWPACRHAHPVIELASRIKEKISASAIRNVTIETYQSAVTFCDDETPDTPHRGRFSLQYCFARTLLYGAPDIHAFTAENLANDTVKALCRKIRISSSDIMTKQFPERYAASVRVELTDGSNLEDQVLTAKGDPENPMSDTELAEKFRLLMQAAGHSPGAVEKLADAIDVLHTVTGVAGLGAALTTIGAPRPTSKED